MFGILRCKTEWRSLRAVNTNTFLEKFRPPLPTIGKSCTTPCNPKPFSAKLFKSSFCFCPQPLFLKKKWCFVAFFTFLKSYFRVGLCRCFPASHRSTPVVCEVDQLCQTLMFSFRLQCYTRLFKGFVLQHSVTFPELSEVAVEKMYSVGQIPGGREFDTHVVLRGLGTLMLLGKRKRNRI